MPPQPQPSPAILAVSPAPPRAVDVSRAAAPIVIRVATRVGATVHLVRPRRRVMGEGAGMLGTGATVLR